MPLRPNAVPLWYNQNYSLCQSALWPPSYPHWSSFRKIFSNQKISVEQRLTRSTLATIPQNEAIEQSSVAQLIEAFRYEEGLAKFTPDNICQIDPRNGERSVGTNQYPSRAHL